MGGTNSELSELTRILSYMQTAVISLETAKNAIKLKYQQLGAEWKDKQYKELGEVLQECNSAFGEILNIMLQGQKYVASLIKKVQEYDSLRWRNSTSSTTSSAPASYVAVSSAPHNDSTNPFCPKAIPHRKKCQIPPSVI